jgi:hypothetical protein
MLEADDFLDKNKMREQDKQKESQDQRTEMEQMKEQLLGDLASISGPDTTGPRIALDGTPPLHDSPKEADTPKQRSLLSLAGEYNLRGFDVQFGKDTYRLEEKRICDETGLPRASLERKNNRDTTLMGQIGEAAICDVLQEAKVGGKDVLRVMSGEEFMRERPHEVTHPLDSVSLEERFAGDDKHHIPVSENRYLGI